jgi:hypothetical protein
MGILYIMISQKFHISGYDIIWIYVYKVDNHHHYISQFCRIELGQTLNPKNNVKTIELIESWYPCWYPDQSVLIFYIFINSHIDDILK